MKDVSVVLAVYNEEKYVSETLESILSQTGLDFEVLVVDDNSTDSTAEIIKSYENNHENIRYIKNTSKGKVSAFNLGVLLAEGKYKCLFAGDDIMPEGSLLNRLKVAKRLNENTPGTGLYKIKTFSEDPKFDGKVVPKRKGKGNPSGQSPLMNEKLVELLFPVPEELPNEDTWLEIAFSHLNQIQIIHSDVICCFWRVHEGNTYNLNMSVYDYKERLLKRWYAFEIFYENFSEQLSESGKEMIKERIKCNAYYENGKFLKILFSKLAFIEKLRMISTINPFFFGLRKGFYGILSGW
ncbi:glycosyltransferase family 2 protein [Balneola vulgaris]|uniref:glycosyltransferase family 2 protein n=1 Tax=Balneola vulgaris TaxID=287535 RepID=UPI00037D963B|nr:glycosyltransferase [Balneola vulgaris]